MMTDRLREAARKLAEQCERVDILGDLNEIIDAYPDVFSALAEPDVCEWISVDERLPQLWPNRHVVDCICATADGQVIAMQWKRNPYATTEAGRAPRWTWWGRNSHWIVTHWMPLPIAPGCGRKIEVKS